MLTQNELLTEDEAARVLGLHAESLHIVAGLGLIPAGVSAYRFRVADLPLIARAFGRPFTPPTGAVA